MKKEVEQNLRTIKHFAGYSSNPKYINAIDALEQALQEQEKRWDALWAYVVMKNGTAESYNRQLAYGLVLDKMTFLASDREDTDDRIETT